MKLNITKKIGRNNYHFQFEGNNLFEVIMESQKLSFGDVLECGICKHKDIYLEAHYGTEDGKPVHQYCSIKCRNCRASVTFGKKKEDSNIVYLRKTEDGQVDWREYSTDNK